VRAILILDPMAATVLAQMLPQQLTVVGVQQTDLVSIPLDSNPPADPTRRRAIVGSLDLDTAVQMNGALAVLVVAEGLQR